MYTWDDLLKDPLKDRDISFVKEGKRCRATIEDTLPGKSVIRFLLKYTLELNEKNHIVGGTNISSLEFNRSMKPTFHAYNGTYTLRTQDDVIATLHKKGDRILKH